MKRIIVIAGVVLGLGTIGAVAAHAEPDGTGPSTMCTNGFGTEGHVLDDPVAVSYEASPSYDGETRYLVCWRTTPDGSTDPEAAGGNVYVSKYENSDTYNVWCMGDRTDHTMVTVDCANSVTPTDDGNPATVGSTVSASLREGTTNPVPVGRTGVDVAVPTASTDLPVIDGTTTTGGTSGLPGGTCVWVDGASNCPFGGLTIGTITVQEDDLPTVQTTSSSPPPPCTGINNTCPGAYVIVGGDRTNSTVNGTVAGFVPVTSDTGYNCVQVNSICPQ